MTKHIPIKDLDSKQKQIEKILLLGRQHNISLEQLAVHLVVLWYSDRPAELERWSPKYDEVYFFIAGDGLIGDSNWSGDHIDEKMWAMGNCFQTHSDACDARDKIKELLLDFHK